MNALTRRLALTLAIATFALAARATDKPVVVPIKLGISHIKLDGRPYTLVSAWLDNGNSHGHNVVNIFADAPLNVSGGRMAPVPVLMPDPADPQVPHEELALFTSGGTECTLDNFRLFHTKKVKGTQLVIAERDFGGSYGEAAPVHFSFYRLVDHSNEDGWRAPLSFDFDHKTEASKSYCDVDEALEKELGMHRVEGASLPWGGGM
jgi:hypothetical protein